MADWTSLGDLPATVQPTEKAVPRISLTVPLSSLAIDLGRIWDAGPILLNRCAQVSAPRMNRVHLSGDIQDLIEGNISAVLHVLDLFTVAFGLLQSFDYHGRSCGHNLNGGVTILADELDSNVHALPCLGGLGDIVTNLLGRLQRIHTEYISEMYVIIG